MSANNPFNVIFVITAIMIIVTSSFAIVAPSFIEGLTIPESPTFPILSDLNAQGNLSDTYPFSQTKNIGTRIEVVFDAFNPDKKLVLDSATALFANYKIQRYGTDNIIPWWYDEPITYVNGTKVFQMSPQVIVNNFNGTYSSFVVDGGNHLYEAHALFSPLPGYTDMASSWNTGRGFTLWMYGFAYAPPAWTDQVVAYLTFGAGIIGFFVFYAAYIVQMSGLLLAFILKINVVLAGGITALILIILVGAMLTFLRGGNSK